ncbi:MAG: hypothetical protein AAF664_03505 [Planctomycetota bacterium]
MPLHELGYRTWDGHRSSPLLRPLVVARGGISLVLKSRWLRLGFLLAWLPVILPTIGIFLFEYSITNPNLSRGVSNIFRGPLQRPDLAQQVLEDPAGARHEVWTLFILTFFRYPQLFAMVCLIGLIAPLLVSYDLRTKAYLMYFSRPLSPTEYIIGKSAVIWFLLGMIVTVPGLALYFVGVLLSPDFSVVPETWDIPFRILGASVVLLVPTTFLAIAYSSLTSENRYATFAWFATWVMGFVSYQILTFSPAAMADRAPRRRRRGGIDWEEMGIDLDRWRLLSPYHTLGKAEAWVFGLDPTEGSVIPAMTVLIVVSVASFWLVRRRLIAKLKA